MKEAGKRARPAAAEFDAEEGAPTTNGMPAVPDADALSRVADEITDRFASRIDRSALVLYDLDPSHLQVQWYVSPPAVEKGLGVFGGEASGPRQVLRVCRVDSDGRSRVVESVVLGGGADPCSGQRDFTADPGEAELECEIGLESRDGGWLLLERSNRIRMQGGRSGVAGAAPVAPGDAVEEPPAPDHGKPAAFEVEPALAAAGQPLHPVFPNPGRAAAPPPATDAAAPPDRPNGSGDGRPVHAGNGAGLPRAGGQSARSAAKDGDALPPPLLPSDPTRGAAAGDLAAPLYDPRAALSSAVFGGGRQWAADIEAAVEVVLRGRGRPGARVDLLGMPVRVETDGQFVVRRTVDAALLLSIARGPRAAHEPSSSERE